MGLDLLRFHLALKRGPVCNCEEIREQVDNVGIYCCAEGGDLKSRPGDGEMEAFFTIMDSERCKSHCHYPKAERKPRPKAADGDPTQRSSLIKNRVRRGSLFF